MWYNYFPSQFQHTILLQAVTPFEVFSRCATLKFKLSWTKGEKHAAGRSQDEYLQNNQIVKQIPGADLGQF